MPTETENYIDEELVRDAERGIERERAPEFSKDEERGIEDDFEISKETDDPALQDILEHKGGHPEDWELTYKGAGEYMFDGNEMISVKTGESLTKEIESGYDAGYISAHHETLQQLKNGESMIRLPDFEEEKENGDVLLHVTHLFRGADNSVTYEIRSTVIERHEEEEVFVVDEHYERADAHARVEFYEEAEVAPEKRVETVPETAERSHETVFYGSNPTEVTFETPAVQEVAPTIPVEQRTEIIFENTAKEVIGETKETVTRESWLYDFLKENIFVPAKKREGHESAPVAPKVEIPSYAEPVTRLVREVVIPKAEHALVVEKVEYERLLPLVEHRARQEKAVETKSSGDVLKKNSTVRSSIERRRPPVDEVKNISKPRAKETLYFDHDSSPEKSRQNERALSGKEILLRSIGLPTTPRVIQTREFSHMEGLRPMRYSPPQQDEQNSPRSSGRVSTLNGISMRRAA